MTKEIDYDKLTNYDVEYLRQRNWLPQPTIEQLDASGLASTLQQLDDEDESNREVVDSVAMLTEEGDDVILEDPEDEVRDLNAMDKPELHAICVARNLPVSGNKGELIARIEAADKS